uniref:Chemokine interleukin-8-like domain-containing protein n=1 Tax=Gasterosteus aculeatus aculeatus TaxID=481459 RepID=A0AAQ4PUZ9_GASAC
NNLHCYLLMMSYISQGVKQMSPVSCCFEFFTGRVPSKQIVSVMETHSSCGAKAFVVTTAKRRKICVGHYVNWAQEAFKKQNVIEG